MNALVAAFVLVAAAGDIRLPRPGLPSHPTPVFDGGGRLWLAFEQGERIYVTTSVDRGRSFAPAVAVTPGPEPIDANGEARPKIAVREDGTVLVTWTRKLDKPYSGQIRFSRSTDGGKTFSLPSTINDDGIVTGHRFDALAVAPSGDVLVAWIDKRDLERAGAEGRPYEGAAVYAAISRDGGRTFEPNRKVKDHICECCRLSFAFDRNGEPLLLFRDLMPGGIRDHSVASGLFEGDGARVRRVTFDDWKIDACPHHGPSFWIDREGTIHLVWFTAGERSGLGAFYARSKDGGRAFDSPRLLGDPERGASHPFVTGVGLRVVTAWLEVDGAENVVRVQQSSDGGASFGPAFPAARGAIGADHPLLVSDGESIFLSWFAQGAGYRLILVEAGGSGSPFGNDIRIGAQQGRAGIEFQTRYGWVPLKDLSMGYRTLMAWVVDLARRLYVSNPRSANPLAVPAVVCIDEIDLHLHQRWQRNLMKFLSEAFPKTQFICTAHNRTVTQAVPRDANIVLLRRKGDHVEIHNHAAELLEGVR